MCTKETYFSFFKNGMMAWFKKKLSTSQFETF